MTSSLRQNARALALVAGQLCVACMLPAQSPAQPGQAAVQKEAVTPSAEDKQKALEADAERLVQLARQLRAELEHTRPDELSVKVLREAEEIERLARSTRTRIR